ncbi:MAG: cupin domain-containing protein [Acidimicrobiia bacterium]
MDVIAGLLDGPRARQAFLLRAVFDPPWSIHVADRAPLSIVAMLRGDAWMTPTGGAPVRLVAGDIAVVLGPDPYDFADAPDSMTQVVIHPGQRCTTPDGKDLVYAMSQGIRTWGTSADGRTSMLIGTYEHVSELGHRLLAALPQSLVVPRSAIDSPLVELLDDEIGKDVPGQQVVLDRLLDLLLVAVLRAWLAEADADETRWYRASADPVVGPALRLLQNNLAHPWTVEHLAAEVGSSRATLARRFSELVGEPPMAFLTEQRLALAADLLLEPGITVGAVADRVGYATPYAFSAAFKRVRGASPREHRRRLAAVVDG